jgi:hypothetical protein
VLQRNARLRLAAFALELKPAVAAVQALRDRRRRLRRAAVPLHPDRPSFRGCGVRLANRPGSSIGPMTSLHELIEILDTQELAAALDRMEKGLGLKVVK